jgi:flagellin
MTKGFTMGFRINTNVAAMNSHAAANLTNRGLDNSLAKLSSGLRINTAADDASGMAIADSLRSQSSALGQAIANANDAIGIIQIADKAMDEQLKILDTIKVKATQAAQDGQSLDSRKALQADINRLMEQLDNIAGTTSYNGQKLLGGSFTNKQFQVGAYSNETVKTSIGATSSDKVGNVRYETSSTITQTSTTTMTFILDGGKKVTMEPINIDYSAGSGLGMLANTINKNADLTGVRATYSVELGGVTALAAGDVTSLTINGVKIGDISGVLASDADGRLLDAINAASAQTGVTASINSKGVLKFTSVDGRGILISANGAVGVEGQTYGRLTLSRLDARDIVVSATGNASAAGLSTGGNAVTTVLNLADMKANITSSDAEAMGALASSANGTEVSNGIGVGVLSIKGAMATMDIAESAQKALDRVRSDLGSTQNQLTVTLNNISVTQVNVRAAESQIRDVDFAAESANFAKFNILAQSGSYAMSQANAVQQNVLRLLQ